MAWPLRDHEVKRITSFFYLATFLLTCTAMAQSGWFRIRGTQCAPHIGLTPFFGFGDFTMQAVSPSQVNHQLRNGDIDVEMSAPATVSYIYTYNDTLACVSPRLVNMMRIILLLCFMIILFSLLGIFVNLSNFKNENLITIQKNGILSVLCVLWVIAVVGVCYYAAYEIELQSSNNWTRNVYVSYEYGFYTITAAGVISLMGAATSFFSFTIFNQNFQRRHLIEDWDGMESFNIGPSSRNRTTRSSSETGPFVPAPPRRSRTIQNICDANRAESLPVVERDLRMLPPPPPYTP